MNQDSKQVASTHQQQILGCMNLNTGAQLENFLQSKVTKLSEITPLLNSVYISTKIKHQKHDKQKTRYTFFPLTFPNLISSFAANGN